MTAMGVYGAGYASKRPLLGLRPPASGRWWNPAPGPVTTSALTLSELMLWPVAMPAMTISDLALEVSTNSTAGFLRAGWYADLDGDPDIASGPLVDYGQVSSGTTGVKTWTPLTYALREGVYWFALVPQTSTCTIRVRNSGMMPLQHVAGDSIPNSAGKQARLIASVTGALPNSGTQTSGNALFPDVFMKAA